MKPVCDTLLSRCNVGFSTLSPDVWFSHQSHLLFFIWTIGILSGWTKVIREKYFAEKNHLEKLACVVDHPLLFGFIAVVWEVNLGIWAWIYLFIPLLWNSRVVRKRTWEVTTLLTYMYVLSGFYHQPIIFCLSALGLEKTKNLLNPSGCTSRPQFFIHDGITVQSLLASFYGD